MAANSKNNNGSDWVTARHGGDGKGKMGSGPAPNPVNHHGAVNAKKSAGKQNDDPDTDSSKNESSEAGGESSDSNSGGSSTIPAYTQSIADKLRKEHGLTHTQSVRIAAGITKKHADGHASVDAPTQMAAKSAHDEMQGMLKKHGSATKAAVGGKK